MKQLKLGMAASAAMALSMGCAPAFAEQEDDRPPLAGTQDPARLLSELRNMRYSGELPSQNGLSPAKPVKLAAPKDARSYTVAYKNRAGCVMFFVPLVKTQHDLKAKWQGSACNGKPLHGKGTLTITHQDDTPSGTITYISVAHGTFRNGMLTGQGRKENFALNPDGSMKYDTYILSGEFAYGVLEGDGTRAWTGPASDHPSATVETGHFSDGTPSGLIIYSRLHPYEGVEADRNEMVLDSSGRFYNYQAYNNAGKKPTRGMVFFQGDETGWNIETAALGPAQTPKAATITGPKDHPFAMQCEAWEFRADGWFCGKGDALFGLHDQIITLSAKSFTMPIPIPASGAPLRIKDGERVMMRTVTLDGESEFSCNSDLSSCRGQTVIPVAGDLYFWGEARIQDGAQKPISGEFLLRAADTYKRDPGRDHKWGYCASFDSPTRCANGTIWYDEGDTWKGGYTLKGISYDAEHGYGSSSNERSLAKDGHGRLTFSSGEWAEARAEDGDLVSVGNCDDPHRSGKITCSLRGSTVVFTREYQEQPQGNSNNYYPNGNGGGRFTPIPIPQRQVTVLPGMP